MLIESNAQIKIIIGMHRSNGAGHSNPDYPVQPPLSLSAGNFVKVDQALGHFEFRRYMGKGFRISLVVL